MYAQEIIQQQKQITQLNEIYDVDGTKELFFANKNAVIGVFQAMHKINGGERKLSSTVTDVMYHILEAYNSIDWEPLGVRGVYYRVVSLFQYPKTEKTYKNIQDVMLKMRRKGILEYYLVIDGSRSVYGLHRYASKSDFYESMARSYRLKLWEDSPYMLEITVEKMAMKSILMPICNKFGLDLAPTSGFNSESAWYTTAERFKEAIYDGKKPILMMMVDYDTAGLMMVESAIKAFTRFGLNGLCEVAHIGLTPDHIEKYNLVTRTDKKDSTMKACELDAMTPSQAREVLAEAITVYADVDGLNEIKAQEKRERFELIDMAKRYENS